MGIIGVGHCQKDLESYRNFPLRKNNPNHKNNGGGSCQPCSSVEKFTWASFYMCRLWIPASTDYSVNFGSIMVASFGLRSCLVVGRRSGPEEDPLCNAIPPPARIPILPKTSPEIIPVWLAGIVHFAQSEILFFFLRVKCTGCCVIGEVRKERKLAEPPRFHRVFQSACHR